MPIYPFKCTNCEEEVEEMMSITAYEEEKDNPIKTCPECGKYMKPMVAQGSSFKLEGSGWYSDGYS